MLQIILTAVLSSSVIVAIIELLRHVINNKAKYMSYERTRTDVSKKLRELIPKVYACNIRTQLIDLLPEIKACLNPYDYSSIFTIENNRKITNREIEHDVLLWDALYKLQNDDKYDTDEEFAIERNKIALYMSCWLKYDWDRYHHEINRLDKRNYKENYIKAMKNIYKMNNNKNELSDIFIESNVDGNSIIYLIIAIVALVLSINILSYIYLGAKYNDILLVILSLLFTIICFIAYFFKRKENKTFIGIIAGVGISFAIQLIIYLISFIFFNKS